MSKCESRDQKVIVKSGLVYAYAYGHKKRKASYICRNIDNEALRLHEHLFPEQVGTREGNVIRAYTVPCGCVCF